MPGFKHTLIGVVTLCDADCTVTFTRAAVIVRDSQGIPVLTVWQEQSGPRLWRIALQPDETTLPSMPHDANRSTLKAYSAYALSVVLFVSWGMLDSFDLSGWRAILQRRGPDCSCQPISTRLPCESRTITAARVNVTVQSASHSGPSPIKVCLNPGMI